MNQSAYVQLFNVWVEPLVEVQVQQTPDRQAVKIEVRSLGTVCDHMGQRAVCCVTVLKSRGTVSDEPHLLLSRLTTAA